MEVIRLQLWFAYMAWQDTKKFFWDHSEKNEKGQPFQQNSFSDILFSICSYTECQYSEGIFVDATVVYF